MRIPFAALLVTLAAATSAFAQGAGSITAPPAVYTIPAGHYDITPSASLVGVSGTPAQNHLFETGWWYRIAGDTAEKFFPLPGTPNFPAGNPSYTVGWTNVDGRGFNATEVGTIFNNTNSGQVVFALTISNPGAAPMTIDLFNFIDIDLAGTAGTDSATLLTPNTLIGITDGAQTAQYRGVLANAFLVRAFGVGDVADLLSNAVVNNFDNSGLPFGPGDFTGGFQWSNIVIAPGGSAGVTAVAAINTTAVPVELMNFQIE